eukprot:CAMPEP_0185161022 /NCGR_PEP_ID=MMETSP1139-20130426/4329_1 /TAXON_ID=298111 /ORGANISM="Pavlova sp., Strain CCMP459" /LENGTH=105 /DNA_ID=CAMNT_0027726253 /DNA_START=42 /DNA_END=359 /DNA_ORIENTATION=+
MMKMLVCTVALCLAQSGLAFSPTPAQRTAFASIQRSSTVMKTGESLAAQLRSQSDDELLAAVDAAKAELYDMRHKRATRQTVKTSDYDAAKYKINVINMILSERK